MSLATPWPLVAGAILATAAGFAGGYALAERLADAKVAEMQARRIECEHARERERREAAEQAAALLARAETAEADAARALAARQAAVQARIRETKDHVDALTTGRECLSAAVRLRLNAALAAADDVPAPAGGAADAAAAAAADPGQRRDERASTDADVARWILDAVERYDDCRARIDAIRHWDEVTHGR